MSDLENHLEEIQNSNTRVEIENFQFAPNGSTHQVIYKDHPLIQEEITTETLKEYKQVAQHYDTWDANEDLPDINGWTNLYGDPYWRHKPANLQFRTAGVLDSRRYQKQLKTPDYFNPNCLNKYHSTEESAILTLLLTLIRYEPEEVAYQHHHQRSIIRQLQEIHGIGQKTAKKLYDLGVRDYPDIKEHSGHIERVYRGDAMEEINEKIEQGIQLIEETGFLDDYSGQHLANTI